MVKEIKLTKKEKEAIADLKKDWEAAQIGIKIASQNAYDANKKLWSFIYQQYPEAKDQKNGCRLTNEDVLILYDGKE